MSRLATLSRQTGIIAMVKSLWGADPQNVATVALFPVDGKLTGGQHRAQHFFPSLIGTVRPLVNQEKEQAGATEIIVIVQTHDPDHMTSTQGDGAFRLVWLPM